jgi:hypothetical protein
MSSWIYILVYFFGVERRTFIFRHRIFLNVFHTGFSVFPGFSSKSKIKGTRDPVINRERGGKEIDRDSNLLVFKSNDLSR